MTIDKKCFFNDRFSIPRMLAFIAKCLCECQHINKAGIKIDFMLVIEYVDLEKAAR